MAEVKDGYGIKDAISKGYLDDKTVYIKAVIDSSVNKYNREPGHVAYWSMDGAVKSLVLPITPGIKEKLFKDLDEQKFFESYFNMSLDPYDKTEKSFFQSKEGRVNIQKDPRLFAEGIPLDLSKPEDNIKFRILNLQCEAYSSRIVCPVNEEPIRKKDILRLVTEDTDAKKELDTTDELIKVAQFIGQIKDSEEKLREFLTLMFYERQENNSVDEAWDKTKILNRINKLVYEPSYRKTMYGMIGDMNKYEAKKFFYQGLRCGVFTKSGVNSYKIEGINKGYSFVSILEELESLRKSQDDVYILAKKKIDERNERNKKKA